MVNKKKNKPTDFTLEDVKRVAELAKLPLSEEETQVFHQQLRDILDLVGKLQNINTEKVEPTNQVTGLENVFREDKVEPSLTQEEALSNAPKKYKGFFMVDAILE